MDGTDVLMLQYGCCLSFLDEALFEFGVLGEPGGEKLESDVAFESHVLGFIHNAHTSTAKLFNQLIFLLKDGSDGEIYFRDCQDFFRMETQCIIWLRER
jgi:hypothetical protein